MKKLGLLATLAMCVTIGGVYAAWTYNDTTSFVDRETVSIGLTPAGNVTGESLEITENTLKFLIDDTDNDKIGDTIDASGSIIVTYYALENNYETVNIYCNIEIDGTLYATTLTDDELVKPVPLDGSGKEIVWEIPAAAFEIKLGTTQVKLPTKADYDAFTIAGNQIRIEFTTAPRA